MRSCNQKQRDWLSASLMASNQQMRKHLQCLANAEKDIRKNHPELLLDELFRTSIHQCRQELASVRKHGDIVTEEGSKLIRALQQLQVILGQLKETNRVQV